MIGTPPVSPPLDETARLRANPATSWGAIFAGSAVAVSLSLCLVTLGAGLGFASMSPWPDRGLSAAAFTVESTIWLIVTQWLSAAAGGYIAGRLRHRWLATHTHEVFFRDTAHGLVTWAVATLFVARAHARWAHWPPPVDNGPPIGHTRKCREHGDRWVRTHPPPRVALTTWTNYFAMVRPAPRPT